jgi:hypothetical protein
MQATLASLLYHNPACTRRDVGSKGKNLLAAYHGLVYVAGRALRPEVALRLVYAMNKEDLAVDETALNCYMAGKALRRRTRRIVNNEQWCGAKTAKAIDHDGRLRVIIIHRMREVPQSRREKIG